MLVGFFPYSFLTYMNRVPSRHTYLASVGDALWIGVAAVALYERLWPRRRLVLATVALAVAVHNIGYLWTRKHRQFTERARPTQELIEVLRQEQGTVVIHCFPMHPIIPMTAVELMIGEPARMRFPTGEQCPEWKYSVEPAAEVQQ
jgi:hypothetical protein